MTNTLEGDRRAYLDHMVARLTFGSYNKDTIAWAITDYGWQMFRTGLLGTTTDHKLNELCTLAYEMGCRDIDTPKIDLQSIRNGTWDPATITAYRYQVCITNYTNALKRGGLLK